MQTASNPLFAKPHSLRMSRPILPCAAGTLLLFLCLVVPTQGQVKKEAKEKEDEKPKPEDIFLQTGDGVQLGLTYYPSRKGRQAVPVVLLHGWKQSRGDFKDLALTLQAQGHAVITPDLRGHGQSTRVVSQRNNEPLDANSLQPSQFSRMVTEDMKAVKNFLWQRNNAGELNIDKLCLVGAEMGASVALDFAWYDATGYEYGVVYYGPRKLGRFVKALVLISPEWSFRGLPVSRALRHPAVQREISMLILVGKQDPKALSEAKRIYSMLERFHPIPEGDDKVEKQTLFFGGFDTSLQGTKLLDPKFNVSGLIVEFIRRRLINSEEAKRWNWQERKTPTQ